MKKFFYLISLLCCVLLLSGLSVNAKVSINFPVVKDASITINNLDDKLVTLYSKYMDADTYAAKKNAFLDIIKYTKKNPYQMAKNEDNMVFLGLMNFDIAMASAELDEVDDTIRGLKWAYKLLIGSNNTSAEMVGYYSLVQLYRIYKALGERTLVPWGYLAKEIVENYPKVKELFPEDYKDIEKTYSMWSYTPKK